MNIMEKKDSSKSGSHHRRHHRHHHARDTIQSAVQLQHPFSFESYNPLRRSHNHQSHRQSSSRESDSNVNPPKPQPAQPQVSPEVEHADRPRKRLVTPVTIAHERKLREQRQDQVSDALNALSRDAHTVTRRLDDTYYSLLEKVATLKATIASIQDLHAVIDQAQTHFDKDSQSLAKHVSSQIDSFAHFSQQDQSIHDLVTRLHNAKQRSHIVESRLESCRSRLESWEKKEKEKRTRNNRRLKLALSCLSAFVVLLVTIIMWWKGSFPHWKHVAYMSDANKTAPGIHLTDNRIVKQHANEDARWQKLLDEL